MVLPDAVDHHAGRQRVLRIGQPVGQLQAAAALAIGGQRLAAEDLQEAARRLGAEVHRVAALVDADVVRLALADGVARGSPIRQLREIARRLLSPRSRGTGSWCCRRCRTGRNNPTCDDRIELVVVAAGAGDGQAEDGLAQRVDGVVDGEVVVVLRVEAEAAGAGDEAGGDQPSPALGEPGASATGGSMSPAICSRTNWS